MSDTLFRSSPLIVKPEWIDYNGHLNMAYYSVLFDQGADQIFAQWGFGPDYAETQQHTTYMAEFHICYLRELHVGDVVTVTFRLMDFDAKRFHSYQEIHHSDGWVAATGEGLSLHIDRAGPRVAPMPDPILSRLHITHKAHETQPRPERAGRKIGIHHKR